MDEKNSVFLKTRELNESEQISPHAIKYYSFSLMQFTMLEDDLVGRGSVVLLCQSGESLIALGLKKQKVTNKLVRLKAFYYQTFLLRTHLSSDVSAKSIGGGSLCGDTSDGVDIGNVDL